MLAFQGATPRTGDMSQLPRVSLPCHPEAFGHLWRLPHYTTTLSGLRRSQVALPVPLSPDPTLLRASSSSLRRPTLILGVQATTLSLLFSHAPSSPWPPPQPNHATVSHGLSPLSAQLCQTSLLLPLSSLPPTSPLGNTTRVTSSTVGFPFFHFWIMSFLSLA